MTHLLPPPPRTASGAVRSAVDIVGGIAHGVLGECMVCRRTCWTWWSPTPPADYAALHVDCVPRLRDLWYLALEESGGRPADEPAPLEVRRSVGAYARRRRTPSRVTAPAVPALSARLGIALPEGFTPGPFWRPGQTAVEPWTVLSQTGAGQVFAPFGHRRDSAEEHLGILRARPVVLHVVRVVGAVLMAPDGLVVDSWGQAPVHGVTRWPALRALQEWKACWGCHEARWPGSWLSVADGRCRACLEPGEVADPRPWPPDPEFPGLATAPHWLGGPKPRKKAGRSTEGS